MGKEMEQDIQIYECLDCGKNVLNRSGCGAHKGRIHKNYELTDENFSAHFKLVKNPDPIMIKKFTKSRANYLKHYGRKKKKMGKGGKPSPMINRLLNSTPKLSKIIEAKATEENVTLTVEIVVPKDFFSTIIIQSLT